MQLVGQINSSWTNKQLVGQINKLVGEKKQLVGQINSQLDK